MSNSANSQFGRLCLQTAWLFQGLVAVPPLLWLGAISYASIFYYYGMRHWLYDFVTNLLNTLFAAGIIFIVLVQRNIDEPSKLMTLKFEVAKSTLATVMWLWLILDRAFGPFDDYYGRPRGPAVVRAAITSILLFLLFYPTLLYAKYDYETEKVNEVTQTEDVESDAADESTALLGSQ